MKRTYYHKKLAKLLEEHKPARIKQCQLARAIKMSESGISHILNGRRKPTDKQSEKISKFIGVPEKNLWLFN